MYASDGRLYTSGKNIVSIEQSLWQDGSNLMSWIILEKMKHNAQKRA